MLLKGILHPEDARLAVSHGIDGITVSNHGGRQLDAAPSPISVLPSIVDAVPADFPVLLESGIRHGADVAGALHLGAPAVLLGRAPLYGLAHDGQRGATNVLQFIAREYERTLVLLGLNSSRAIREPAHI